MVEDVKINKSLFYHMVRHYQVFFPPTNVFNSDLPHLEVDDKFYQIEGNRKYLRGKLRNLIEESKPEPQKPKVSPRAQRWIDANSDWWGKDEEMSLAAMGLDKKLTREYGEEYVGTEEYFRTIDKTMRKRFPEYFNTQSDEDDPPPKKRADPVDEDDEPPRRAQKSVVAPASRSTSPNRIKLKASEAAIARRLGVPLEQYAKQVALLNRSE